MSRDSAHPTDAEALEALRVLREWLAREGRAEVAVAPVEHDQRDGHRPSCLPTRTLFLRAWRALAREGHVGVTRAGRLRVMSAAAADEWARRLDDRGRAVAARARHAGASAPPPVADIDELARRALGLRRASGGRR